MNLSLSEFSSLCRVAAKGAGFSWGQAQDVSGACKWLAARGLWPAGHVKTMFDQSANSPFWAGMTFVDSIDDLPNEGSTIKGVSCPVAILPFVSLLGISCEVTWDNASFLFDGDGMPDGECSHDISPNDVTIVPKIVDKIAGTTHTRIDILQLDWDSLQDYAGRTYAPATDESRRLGAG